jgi:hypothetical protein
MLIQDLKINKFKSTFGIIVKCLTKVLFKKKIIHFFSLSLKTIYIYIYIYIYIKFENNPQKLWIL